jgi:hypothetical protein
MIYNELVDLASKDVSPSPVCDEPKMDSCCTSKRGLPKGQQELKVKRLFCNNHSKDRGVILIHGLWTKGTDCILDVRMAPDLDVKSNKSRKPSKVLAAHLNKGKRRSIWSPALNNDDIFLLS